MDDAWPAVCVLTNQTVSAVAVFGLWFLVFFLTLRNPDYRRRLGNWLFLERGSVNELWKHHAFRHLAPFIAVLPVFFAMRFAFVSCVAAG